MTASFLRIVYLVLITHVLDNVTATCPDTHTESWKKKNENCSDGKKYHCQYDAETQLKVDFCATPVQCEAGKRAALHSEKETISCEECGPDMYQPESKWSNESIQPNCDRRVDRCVDNTLVCKEATSTQNNLCKCNHTAGYRPDNIQDCGCFDPRTSLCHCIQSDCKEDEILSEAYKCIPAGKSSSSSPFEVTTQGNERSSKSETFLKFGLPMICVFGVVFLVVVLVMMKRKKMMCFQNPNSETTRISYDKQVTTPNSEVEAKVERDGENPARPIHIKYYFNAQGANIGVLGDGARVTDQNINAAPTQTPNVCDDNDLTTDGDQDAGAPLVDKDDL